MAAGNDNKKYKFVEGDIKEVDGHSLHRIEALVDIDAGGGDGRHIHAGDLGGYIESENNLAYNDNSWVSDDACVYDRATISGDSLVEKNAAVYGDAVVSDESIISDNAVVADHATTRCVFAYDNAVIRGNAWMKSPGDRSIVVRGNAVITNGAICNASLFEHDACICSDSDYISLVYDCVTFTFYKCKHDKIGVNKFPMVSEPPIYTGWLSDFEYELEHGNWDKKKREAWSSMISAAKSILGPNSSCPKYEFVEGDTKQISDYTLQRIRATRDFNDVKAGDLGGYIDESSHIDDDGNCWVYDGAIAIVSHIRGNAVVRDNAAVQYSSLSGDAVVEGDAKVYWATLCSDALIRSSNDYSTTNALCCRLKHKYPLTLNSIGIILTAFKCVSKPKIACNRDDGISYDDPEEFIKCLNKVFNGRGEIKSLTGADNIIDWAKETLSELQ